MANAPPVNAAVEIPDLLKMVEAHLAEKEAKADHGTDKNK